MKRNRLFIAILVNTFLIASVSGCGQGTKEYNQENEATIIPSSAALDNNENTSEDIQSGISIPDISVSAEENPNEIEAPQAVGFIENGQDIIAESTWDISLADIDSDDDPDAYFEYGLWLNDGKGSFTKTETTFGTKDAYFADFNGDDFQDAVSDNVIHINDGKGNFTQTTPIPSDISMLYAKASDMDNDGDIDLISVDQNSDRLLINDGNGMFTNTGITFGGWSQCRYATGDINKDGFCDIYMAIPHTPPPSMTDTRDKIWLGDGLGHFTEKANTIKDGESRDVIMEDFDLDGNLDLFIADSTSSSRLLLNNGTGDFTESRIPINNGNHATAIKSADFNGDGNLDILFANGKPLDNGRPNTLWLGDGKGYFIDSNLKLGNSNSMQLEIGDLNGDSSIDAIIVNVDINTGSAPVEIWLNQGIGLIQ